MIRKLISIVLATSYLAALSVALPGCNTVEGAGKDISAGGNKIKEEAREHK